MRSCVPGPRPPVAVVSHETPESSVNRARLLPFLASTHVLIVLASLSVTHQYSPTITLTRMAQDITVDFRNVVEQKRNGLGDTRRSKPGRPSHPPPGDTQLDDAPPFMQAYMKEAYTIVSRVALCFCLSLSYA